jgi:hypothetical protein
MNSIEDRKSDVQGYTEWVLKGGPGTKRFLMKFPVKKQEIPAGKTVIKKQGYTLRMKNG